MTEKLPEPLISSEVDLTDFKFMPLHVVRVRDSDILDATSGEEFKAAFLLWCASWHQVPCGSLPDNDLQLAKFAGYGRVLKEWAKVKAGAMRGYIKCSDGRWYHPVICEVAMESWESRSEKVKRLAADRARKKAKRLSDGGQISTVQTEDVQRTNAKIPPDTEQQSSGQGDILPSENSLKGREESKGREERERTTPQSPPSPPDDGIPHRPSPPAARPNGHGTGPPPQAQSEETLEITGFERSKVEAMVVHLSGKR